MDDWCHSVSWGPARNAVMSRGEPTPVACWDGPTVEGPTCSATPIGEAVDDLFRERPPRSGRWVGRYLLIELIGSGGQATVWRAVRDDPVVREVALKLIHGHAHRCPRKLARLRREAERGMRLQSRTLLPALDFGSDGEITFMAMPLIHGLTLGEVIKQRRGQSDRSSTHRLCRVPWDEYLHEVLKLLVGVARSLHEAHSAQVAHRDIKPSNILIDAEAPGVAYLIDFGLSRDLDVATQEQLRDCAGTPQYMSPEKLLSRQSDEVRCDLYALGVTIYEALTLQPPFETPKGLSGVPLMAYLSVHRPLTPRPSDAMLHPRLLSALWRAMDPSPANRHATAAHLADELEGVLASGSVLDPRGRGRGYVEAVGSFRPDPPDREGCRAPSERPAVIRAASG